MICKPQVLPEKPFLGQVQNTCKKNKKTQVKERFIQKNYKQRLFKELTNVQTIQQKK